MGYDIQCIQQNRFNGLFKPKPEKMPHSFNKIWIHAIWSTKKRTPLIIPKIEKQIHDNMRNEFTESGRPVRNIMECPTMSIVYFY